MHSFAAATGGRSAFENRTTLGSSPESFVTAFGATSTGPVGAGGAFATGAGAGGGGGGAGAGTGAGTIGGATGGGSSCGAGAGTGSGAGAATSASGCVLVDGCFTVAAVEPTTRAARSRCFCSV